MEIFTVLEYGDITVLHALDGGSDGLADAVAYEDSLLGEELGKAVRNGGQTELLILALRPAQVRGEQHLIENKM